jgi:hypothetical protein
MTGNKRQPWLNMHHGAKLLNLTSSGLQHIANNCSGINRRDGTLINTDTSHRQNPFHALHKIPAVLFEKREPPLRPVIELPTVLLDQ